MRGAIAGAAIALLASSSVSASAQVSSTSPEAVAVRYTKDHLRRSTTGPIRLDPRRIPGPGRPSSSRSWRRGWSPTAADTLLRSSGLESGPAVILCPGDPSTSHLCRLEDAAAVIAVSESETRHGTATVRVRTFLNLEGARPGDSGVGISEADLTMAAEGSTWRVVDRTVRFTSG